LNSRGRFFTAEWTGRLGFKLKENIKIKEIVGVSTSYVDAWVYVPRIQSHLNIRFPIDSRGDCTYIASDRSKFQMSGQRALNF
jgi:hypothetical protein